MTTNVEIKDILNTLRRDFEEHTRAEMSVFNEMQRDIQKNSDTLQSLDDAVRGNGEPGLKTKMEVMKREIELLHEWRDDMRKVITGVITALVLGATAAGVAITQGWIGP